MFLFVLLVVLFWMSPLIIWVAVIRPYCIRNGKGYTPGAKWDVTLWIDWQEASEMAAEKSDARMLGWCRFFLVMNLMMTFGMLVGLAGSMLRG